MPVLYPYQLQTIDELDLGFETHLRQIAVLPTGGGKTVLFSEIALRAVTSGKVVLVLTDRIELFNSACDAISGLNIPICKINKDNNNIYAGAKMFVGMVETVARRLAKMQGINFDLIIIDECHRGNFFKILDAYPNVKTIGFTATPIHKKIPLYYTNMINVIDIPELVDKGYLVPCHPYQVVDDFSDIETESDEFDESLLFNHFNSSKLYDGVIDWYRAVCAGKQTIVFNVNIDHSNKMAADFNAAGIKSYSITSKTPDDERKYILESFARGDFPVLNNCGILTTGYNEPTIEAVIVNRATKSLALWLQMQGRGSRICPAINKKKFIVVDFGMNHGRHGWWDDVRTWSLNPPDKKKKRNRFVRSSYSISTKDCLKCRAVMSAQAVICRACGHGSGLSTIPKLSAGILIDLKTKIPVSLVDKHISDLSVIELVDLQNTGLHTEKSITRVILARGASAIAEYASITGKPDTWINEQLNTIDANKKAGIKIAFSNYKIKQVEV